MIQTDFCCRIGHNQRSSPGNKCPTAPALSVTGTSSAGLLLDSSVATGFDIWSVFGSRECIDNYSFTIVSYCWEHSRNNGRARSGVLALMPQYSRCGCADVYFEMEASYRGLINWSYTSAF